MALGRLAAFTLCTLFCAMSPLMANEPVAPEHAEPALHDALMKLDAQSHEDLDTAAMTRLRTLLAEHDWPTVAQVGRDGVDAAGRLVEHANCDADFQHTMLRSMRYRIGIDIDAQAYAALSDRIAVSHGQPQEYGTQLAIESGKVTTSPTESVGSATEYRDSIGLSFMDVYLQQIQSAVNDGRVLSDITRAPSLSTEPHPLTQPGLRQDLRDMFKADQKARLAFIKAGMKPGSPEQKAVMDVDAANIARVKAIIDQYGFPDAGMIGRNGISALFFLAEHAEEDTVFMNRVLDLAHPLVEKHQLSHQAYAVMVDRQLVLQGRPQIYGSQLKMENGHSVPLPLTDPAHLEQRRAAMGIEPYDDYLKENDEMYQASVTTPTTTQH